MVSFKRSLGINYIHIHPKRKSWLRHWLL